MVRIHPRPNLIERLEPRRLLSIVAVGGEIAINGHTTGQQVAPRVATRPNGEFIVVWASVDQAGPGSGQDVYARRFAPSGVPLDSEFRVNTFTTSDQSRPAIAMDDAGNFVVAWASQGQDGAGGGIYAQRFTSQAQPIGEEFRVNTYTAGDEGFPAAAMDPGGDFVVTWDTYNPNVGAGYDVYAQRFDAQGQPRGGEILVNSDVASHEYSSAVAMDGDGDFVVLWNADAQDGSGHGVYGRRFDSSGAALGDEFRVNTSTPGDQLFPSVAMTPGGAFVAVWDSAPSGNTSIIAARRFDASGVPLGDEFVVNTLTTPIQQSAAVAVDDAGNFLVTWESFGPDQSLLGIEARAFRADGTALGNEFGVNTHVIGDQAFAHVAMDGDGDAVVAWQSFGQDGDQNGIYARRYRLDEIAPTVTDSFFRYERAPQQVRITFSEDVSTSLSEADLTVVNTSGGPPIPTTLVRYDSSTNTAWFAFAQTLDDGQYRATLAAAGVSDLAGNVLAADHVLDFFFLTGDANHDGRVNLLDFNTLAANFGQSNRDFTQGDFNYDTVVNLTDFNLLAARFGTVLSPGRRGGGSDSDSDAALADADAEEEVAGVVRLLHAARFVRTA